LLQLPLKRLAAMLFGMIALFESAVQKFLVMTLIFGKSVWEALDLFFNGILKDLALNGDFSFSFWLITTYTACYTLWGILLGWWSSSLPHTLLSQRDNVLQQYAALSVDTENSHISKKKGRGRKLIAAFFILLFVCSVFLFKGEGVKAWFAILRTIAALLLLFFIINPMVKWAMGRWVERNKQKQQLPLASIIDMLPGLRSYLVPAMTLARQRHKGIGRYRGFVVNLIILSLYNDAQGGEEQ
jgi:hypothetical protein